MNLREIRKQFVHASGRFDLRNDDGTDNGADFYLQAGQKHLENLVHYDKAKASHYVQLNGLSGVVLPQVRTVETVLAKTLTESARPLTRMSLAQALTLVDACSTSEIPSYYLLIRSRGNAESLFFGIEMLSAVSAADVSDGTRFDSHALIVFPALQTTQVVQLEVIGLTRESLLHDDTDENFWSLQWPSLLVYAGLRELEVLYRNTAGVRDWDVAIQGTLTALEFDAVQDESDQITKILG